MGEVLSHPLSAAANSIGCGIKNNLSMSGIAILLYIHFRMRPSKQSLEATVKHRTACLFTNLER